MKNDLYLCIHGHFYQPPRENPWIEEIERQESAEPFHDWNERIYRECYLPNARARVLDEKGRVLDITNNYEEISFNFGPTLFSWMERKHPEAYTKILEADKASRKKFSGHGNAIAQVYNHMIMPLASRRDKETQVFWGIEDFRRRFGREPESIWLPETGCNRETLEVLIAFGMRYCILAPNQAEAVRSLGGGDWQDVSSGQIDPRMPYRFFSKTGSGKFIDLFFYDGPVSQAMGFENLLFDAKLFVGRLEEAVDKERDSAQLVHVATDGETYGHHKAFGDRVLAYTANVEAPRRGFKLINYGAYLDMFPPQHEVRLKDEDGEGTSWSCAHGVKRWKEHCGCRGGGEGFWNQHWRKPLREALDWLRDETVRVFESQGPRYLSDIWQARNEYIRLLLDHSEKNFEGFFRKHAPRELSQEEKVLCLKLLECQRYAMLMYTSCGWFFTEISGIETVQILEYAARSVQLAREIEPAFSEEEFLKKLSRAESNIPEFKNGREIYEKRVRAKILFLEDMAAFYAIQSLVGGFDEPGDVFSFYSTRIKILHQRKEASGDLTLNFGAIRITSQRTLESEEYIFIAVHMGLYEFRCSVKKMTDRAEPEKMEKIFFDELHSLHIVEMLRKMDDVFGEKYYALKDLPIRERRMIIRTLTREQTEKISGDLERLYDDNRRMNEIYRSVNLSIPEQIRYAGQHTLERRLRAAVREAVDGFQPKKINAVHQILESAKALDVRLRTGEEIQFLSRELEKRIRFFSEKHERELLFEASQILRLAKKTKWQLDVARPQDHLFFLLNDCAEFPEKVSPEIRIAAPELLQLAADLNIHTERFKKVLQS